MTDDCLKREDVLSIIAMHIELSGTDIEKVALAALYYQLKDLEPAADAVPVVRCKDCRYWGSNGYPDTAYQRCMAKIETITPPDWFCASGRQKDIVLKLGEAVPISVDKIQEETNG